MRDIVAISNKVDLTTLDCDYIRTYGPSAMIQKLIMTRKYCSGNL